VTLEQMSAWTTFGGLQSMREASYRRLRRLCAELEPARVPWYVDRPSFRSATPSAGWWWIPRGGERPEYLGHNHIVAEVQLQSLLESLEKPRGA
jgi:hypothetical protein